MSKPPKNTGKSGEKKEKQPVLYLRLDRDTDAAISAYISRQPVPPERTQFAITAIHKLLAEHGLWPPKKDGKQ